MAGRAIDYMASPSVTLFSRWRAARVVGVIRYVGAGANSKYITERELHGLRDNDIAIGWVYETTVTWMLAGVAAGRAAATSARNYVRNIGGPSDPVIYFACDFDVTSVQISRVLDTIKGASDVLGARHTGIYGSGYVLEHCIAGGYAYYGWLAGATAWAHGSVKPQLTQHVAHSWGELGIDYDGDTINAVDWGQWPSPGGTPTPAPTGGGGTPPPAPAPTPPEPGGTTDWDWHNKVVHTARNLGAGNGNAAASLTGLADLRRNWRRP